MSALAHSLIAKRTSPPWTVDYDVEITRYDERPPLIIKRFPLYNFELLKHGLDSSDEVTNEPTTKSSSPEEGEELQESYKMAAQVAVGAAIIVALAILLALIWNSLKRRVPDSNNSGMSSSATRRRHSSDSLDRLVEDRLRNRPPPYSPDQDKPPSYEESFHDSSVCQQTPFVRGRDRRRHHRNESSSSGPARVHETNRVPRQSSRHQSTAQSVPSLPSYSSAIRVVSYDNQAFNADDEQHNSTVVDIPSISGAVHQSELARVSPECENDDSVMHSHL